MADSDPSSAGRPSGFTRLVPSRAPEDLREDPLLAFLPRDADGRPVVGRIPILCRLGRGGMGAVYYSIHPRLNVEVAVKLLPPDLADQNPKLIERFVSEARLAVALENEHVVRVYDVDCEGKTHFLVMQYVEGESAGAFLKRRKAEGRTALDESEALAIVTAATRGLAAAHARGIIHRDIKPDNILIPRGELAKAKLADLGLAKPEGGEASLGTMSHVAMGTPGYMAPEQAEDAKTAGAAADVFSMGATLYALLTGRAPFAGSSLAVVLRDTAMKDPAPLPGHVSAGTRAVVERCLAKDPKARFANGAALLAALERGAEALPTPVTAPAAYEPTLMPMPEVKPRKAWILPAAVGAVLLIAGAVWFAVRPGEKPRQADASPTEDPGKKERLERAEKIAAILKQVEALEGQDRLEDALATLTQAAALDADDEKVRAAKRRIEGKIKLARSAEQKRDAYRGYMTSADIAKTRAESLETAEGWSKVVEICAKAEPNAQTEEETKAVRDLAALAGQRRDLLLAREAEAKGDLDGAIDLAKKAGDGRYLTALEGKRKARAERAARKKEFDEWSAQARAEKDPATALALWKRAEGLAEEPADKAEAAGQVERLRGEIVKIEEDRRRREEAERLQKEYEQAMTYGEAAEEAKQWEQAKAAYERALKLKPGDPAALAGLKGCEKNLTPGKIVLDLGGGVKMEFVLIKAGKFRMGSNIGDPDEKPAHVVEISRDFWMQVTETTQAQWETVLGSNPSRFRGADLPVEQVSWEDCQEFLRKLNEKAKDQLKGRTAGLPTEAQWEYACRAGSTGTWSFGEGESKLGDCAWYVKNSDSKTHPVGQKIPNAWGLYDMHGNVWEWCGDWYGAYGEGVTDVMGPATGEYRCLRGGSWYLEASRTRSADRGWLRPSHRCSYSGLRVVLRAVGAGASAGRSSKPGFLGAKVDLSPDGKRLIVNEVLSASPAEKAGLKAGDALLSVAGREVAATRHLSEIIGSMNEGDVVEVRYLRDGREGTARVTLGTRPPSSDPGRFVLDFGGGVKMEFVLIKAGKFMMGSGDFAGEKPVHEVTLTKDFWMQTTETTQAQWQVVMGANPSGFKGVDLPVDNVTWEDGREFLKRLNEKAKEQLKGKSASLPTEAEWEYACRAGSAAKWCFGEDESKLGDYAWYDKNSDSKTHPVGRKKPNAWGLYDMHGNVWEWCEDWYRMYGGKETDPTGPTRGELRCIRGACWDNVPINVRSANRNWYKPSQGHSTLGLRCVLRQP